MNLHRQTCRGDVRHVIAVGLVALSGAWHGPVLASSASVLPEPVEIVDVQSGFAGETGTLTSIEADGSYTVARVFNDIVKAPHRRDRLTAGQAARLAEALQRVEGTSLPEQMGSDATNIRRIEVTIGESRTRLYLDPIVMPTERYGHAEETLGATLLEIVEIAEELDPDGWKRRLNE